MIPKIIHYCWFGGNALPESAKKCIESWKKYCPGYEVKQWNEQNFDINKYQYTKEAYDRKKYAFVSDVARLDIIYNEGGIYLDTDVELLKSLDDLLSHQAYMGMENIGRVATGLGFGAEEKHPMIAANLSVYKDIPFTEKVTCVTYTTNLFKDFGLKNIDKKQTVNQIVVYPTEFFCPKTFETGKIDITENTYSIHHFSASWLDDIEREYIEVQRKYRKRINSEKLVKILSLTKVYIKSYGIKSSWMLGKRFLKSKK